MEVVVGADAGDVGQHGIVLADFKRLVAGQRPERSGVLLKGLHAERANDVVVPARAVVALPVEWNVGEEVSLRAEVAAHAVREGVLIVGVVHGEEVGAEVRLPNSGEAMTRQ